MGKWVLQMGKLVLISLVIGFVLGAILALVIAPIGLGSAFVVRLFPVLAPGFYFFRSISRGSMAAGLILNGLIYTVPVFVILLVAWLVSRRKADSGHTE